MCSNIFGLDDEGSGVGAKDCGTTDTNGDWDVVDGFACDGRCRIGSGLGVSFSNRDSFDSKDSISIGFVSVWNFNDRGVEVCGFCDLIGN